MYSTDLQVDLKTTDKKLEPLVSGQGGFRPPMFDPPI